MEIAKILLSPHANSDYDNDISDEEKLWHIFQPEKYLIYRRKVLMSFDVHGLWWTGESEFLKFESRNRYAHVKAHKEDNEVDKVSTTRKIQPGMCYIREDGERVDIEGQTWVTKYNRKTKKYQGGKREMLTVTISRKQYDDFLLDGVFGPVDDVCRHNEEDFYD